MAAKGSVALLQFARSPEIGGVKTRLIPALGARNAHDLHLSMLLHTLGVLQQSALGPVQLWLTDTQVWPLAVPLPVDVTVLEQSPGNLGQRMEAALSAALQRAEKVVLVGSDAPLIDASYLQRALFALDTSDVVFGPAVDGGYVLVGVRRIHPGWLDGVDWGTERALAQSRAAALRVGLSCACLEALNDIDTPLDLPSLPPNMVLTGADGKLATDLVRCLEELRAQ